MQWESESWNFLLSIPLFVTHISQHGGEMYFLQGRKEHLKCEWIQIQAGNQPQLSIHNSQSCNTAGAISVRDAITCERNSCRPELRNEILAMLVPNICSEGLAVGQQNLFPSQVASCNVSFYTPERLWARYKKAASSLWVEQSYFFLPLPISNINKHINNNLPRASLLL